MKVLKDFKNDLLKRREVGLVVENSGNPGFVNSLKMITEQFKAKEENVVVKEVSGAFGRDTFLIKAFIYDSAGAKAKVEPKPKVKKAAEGAK